MNNVCPHCGAFDSEHDYEQLARSCYPAQIKKLRDEVEEFRSIRDTCIKALMIATGASREAIEAAPYENAYRASKERTANLSQ